MKASVASHLSGDLFVAIPGVSCIATFKDLLQVCKKNGICLVEAFDMDGKLLPKEVEKGQEGNHITVESAREKWHQEKPCKRCPLYQQASIC